MEFICSGITSIGYPRWYFVFYKCTFGIRYLSYLSVHILDTHQKAPVNVSRQLIRGRCITLLCRQRIVCVYHCVPLEQRYLLPWRDIVANQRCNVPPICCRGLQLINVLYRSPSIAPISMSRVTARLLIISTMCVKHVKRHKTPCSIQSSDSVAIFITHSYL